MPSNTAAWIASSRARFTVKEAPYMSPNPDEVLIEVSAVAVNPLGYKIQDRDPIPTFPITYPTILGSDIAGTIVELGSNVKSLQVGQHVVAHTTGFATSNNRSSGFQRYTVVNPIFITPLPSSIPFQDAAVFPLAIDTAAAGLFQADHLGLSLASLTNPVDTSAQASARPAILVWGGTSSVGCNVIQLARACGLAVLTTASERNFGLCEELGRKKLKGRTCVGAFDCVGEKSTQEPCAEILSKVNGTKKLVVSVLAPSEGMGLPDGVTVKRCFIRTMFTTEIPWTVHAWVGKALEEGRMVPKPEAKVVGQGLEAIQGGLDELRKGVSARKLVVQL